jgi:hypothetical protein
MMRNSNDNENLNEINMSLSETMNQDESRDKYHWDTFEESSFNNWIGQLKDVMD